MSKQQVVLIVHNVRSAHNVGSLLRTADGLGIDHVYLTGYTPYPALNKDTRLPHIASKVSLKIHKTALGAEDSVDWSHQEDINDVFELLHEQNFLIAALEQTAGSKNLSQFKPPNKIALLVGSEVTGLPPDVIKAVDVALEIPMQGKKESFNVSVAAAIGLYHLRLQA